MRQLILMLLLPGLCGICEAAVSRRCVDGFLVSLAVVDL